jgi:hypothetical protein
VVDVAMTLPASSMSSALQPPVPMSMPRRWVRLAMIGRAVRFVRFSNG